MWSRAKLIALASAVKIDEWSARRFAKISVSNDDEWLDTSEDELPCSFTLVARCRIVLSM